MKQISGVPLLALTLDPQSSISLYQQLYDGLRSAILSGLAYWGNTLTGNPHSGKRTRHFAYNGRDRA